MCAQTITFTTNEVISHVQKCSTTKCQNLSVYGNEQLFNGMMSQGGQSQNTTVCSFQNTKTRNDVQNSSPQKLLDVCKSIHLILSLSYVICKQYMQLDFQYFSKLNPVQALLTSLVLRVPKSVDHDNVMTQDLQSTVALRPARYFLLIFSKLAPNYS